MTSARRSSSPRPLRSTRRPKRVSSPNTASTSGPRRGPASWCVVMTSTRISLSARARKASSSSDGRSAVCRSSSRTTSGSRAAVVRRKTVTASKSAKRACSDSRSPASGRSRRSRSSGASWATHRAPAPSSARKASSSRSAASARTICTHGQNAGAPPPSQPRAQATRWPSAAARSPSAVAKRVLPMPGSPVSSTRPPWPADVSSSVASRSASSRARPRRGSSPVAPTASERWLTASPTGGTLRAPSRRA